MLPLYGDDGPVYIELFSECRACGQNHFGQQLFVVDHLRELVGLFVIDHNRDQ